jgi:hypothetical protein
MDEIRDPQYRSADGSALRIWRDTAKNAYLSEREGRAIFDDVTYVEVISPGSRDSTPVFECVRVFAPEMNHPDPLYGTKYEEYKGFIADFEKAEANDTSLSGTPLSEWKEMTRTMVAALKAQNIFTVDALAALPDTKLSAVGPDGRTWREKAKAYIEDAKGSAYATGLAADLERTKGDLAASEARVTELADQVKALQEAQATGKSVATVKAATKVDTPADPASSPII